MTAASKGTSLAGRMRMYAMAGIISLGLMLPIAQIAQADYEAGADDASPATAPEFTISVETVEQLTGLTAVVSTGGGDVNLRSEASDESDSLAKVVDGTTVNLRVDMVDTVYDDNEVRWWPVSVGGTDGWISGEVLTNATTADGEVVSPNLVPFDYIEQADQHSTARVSANGQQVNVRMEPGGTSEIVTKAADGQVISLRIDRLDTVYDAAGVRWWPVVVNGMEGWVSGYFLVDSDGSPTSNPDETPNPVTTGTDEPATTDSPSTTEPDEPEASAPESSADAAKFTVGEFAQVFLGDGGSLNVRESGSPNAAVVGSLPDGDIVGILSGPVASSGSEAGWYEVTNSNATGFVDGDLLITSVESTGRQPLSTEPALSEEEEATVAATQTPAATTVTTSEPTTEPQQTPDSTQASQPTAVPTEASQPTAAPTQASAEFIYPLESYTRTQAFGCSNLGFYSYNAEYGCPLHNGLDLAAPSGTPILASKSGTVVTAGWCNCGLGYYVEIDHGGGVHTLYGHMASQPYVSAGQSVNQGDVIGPLGSTGISTGPHIHFMVTVNGTAQNPENYLP